MHRTWVVDVAAALQVGDNDIEIIFSGEASFAAAGHAEKRLPCWNVFHDAYAGKSYLRKMACAFGWDWGPMAPTVGIWRDITLVGVDVARLEGVRLAGSYS